MGLCTLFAGLRRRQEPITIVVILVLVFLFAFASLACCLSDNPSENREISGSASRGVISVAVPFNSLSFVVTLASGFIATILVPEYLSSHIGEKRFADGTLVPPLFALLLGCFVTALSVVPSLFILLPLPKFHAWLAGGSLLLCHFSISLDEGICNKRRYLT